MVKPDGLWNEVGANARSICWTGCKLHLLNTSGLSISRRNLAVVGLRLPRRCTWGGRPARPFLLEWLSALVLGGEFERRSSPLVTLLMRFLNWSRGVIQRTRRSDGGVRLSPKCPNCGAPDLRMSDRQLTRPDVYGSRTFRVKWLCLRCGYRTSEDVEELN